MNKPAITPAAECPSWCTSTHEGDQLLGYVLHEGKERVAETGEVITPGLTEYVIVRSEAFVGESPDDCYPQSIRLDAFNTYGASDAFVLSLRQALRLAEFLVQEVSTALAEAKPISPAVTR